MSEEERPVEEKQTPDDQQVEANPQEEPQPTQEENQVVEDQEHGEPLEEGENGDNAENDISNEIGSPEELAGDDEYENPEDCQGSQIEPTDPEFYYKQSVSEQQQYRAKIREENQKKQSNKISKYHDDLTNEKAKLEEAKNAGKTIIYIQTCYNCQTHQWCTKHKEEKYQEYKTKIETACISVLGDNCHCAHNTLGPQFWGLGCFDVWVSQ